MLGHGLRQHDIALMQHLVRPRRRGAYTLVLLVRAGPGDLAHRHDAATAIDKADFGTSGAHVQDHGKSPRCGTGRRCDGCQMMRPDGVHIDMADRTAIAVTAIIGDQAIAQGLVGIGLQHRVEAGPHAQAALIDQILTEMGDQLASDFLIEIGRAENL